jgi:hypothetical protein
MTPDKNGGRRGCGDLRTGPTGGRDRDRDLWIVLDIGKRGSSWKVAKGMCVA